MIKKQDVIDFFNRCAPSWDAEMIRDDGIINTILDNAGVSSGKTVLDVACDGRTGVEMEALTAVSTAALTVYDMCKAVQKDMVITDIRLLRKTGGVHGDFERIGDK